jgi:hypothetical protein
LRRTRANISGCQLRIEIANRVGQPDAACAAPCCLNDAGEMIPIGPRGILAAHGDEKPGSGCDRAFNHLESHRLIKAELGGKADIRCRQRLIDGTDAALDRCIEIP